MDLLTKGKGGREKAESRNQETPAFQSLGIRRANPGGREAREGLEEGGGQPRLEGFRNGVVGWPDTP